MISALLIDPRREWRRLSIVGWIFTATALYSFFGGTLLFGFGAEYYAQAFNSAPINRVFENPDPARFSLLIPVFVLLQGGLMVGPLFSWLRIKLFIGEDQVVSKNTLSALVLAGFGLSFIMVSCVVYAEFYARSDAEWRSFVGLAITITFFYLIVLSIANISFGLLLYRAKIVPTILASITILLGVLAFCFALLTANPDAPAVMTTASVSMSSADFMLWSGLLWYWSRPAAVDAFDTETVMPKSTTQ